MHLDLTDDQTEALIRELHSIIQNDRYPLSPRIVALKEILGRLRPEPERPLLVGGNPQIRDKAVAHDLTTDRYYKRPNDRWTKRSGTRS
jgi:hypothetical protein